MAHYLLINGVYIGVYWGYNPLILTFYILTSPRTSNEVTPFWTNLRSQHSTCTHCTPSAPVKLRRSSPLKDHSRKVPSSEAPESWGLGAVRERAREVVGYIWMLGGSQGWKVVKRNHGLTHGVNHDPSW